MRTQKYSGFTIIEVMLFLAITGALTVALLVGSGAAINRQRYRDSVNTFKGLIQEQYGQITNTVNTEPENPICQAVDTILAFPDGSRQARGTSNCLIMGRFLLVEPQQIRAYNLIGLPPGPDDGDDDDSILRSYTLAIERPEVHEVAWGAQIVGQPGTEDSVPTSILIIRSPRSGSILTYVQDGDQSGSIRDMITADNTRQRNFCVDPDGSLEFARRRLAVRINERAANQSAIEIPLENEGVCGS